MSTPEDMHPDVALAMGGKGKKFGGVGMPATLLLHEFGSQVWAAFGDPPYHVGSSLKSKIGYRDVDVRLILGDEEYAALFPGIDPRFESHDEKWVALVLAFSALGRQMTGLPIDFQIQQMTRANELFPDEPRSALGMTPRRMARASAPEPPGDGEAK